MNKFQTQFTGDRRARPRALRVATVVCLLLLALLAVVQVAHVHPTDTDSDHCPLCIAMHSAAPVAVTAPAVVEVPVERAVPIYVAHTVARPWHPTLFTRPPPDGLKG